MQSRGGTDSGGRPINGSAYHTAGAQSFHPEPLKPLQSHLVKHTLSATWEYLKPVSPWRRAPSPEVHSPPALALGNTVGNNGLWSLGSNPSSSGFKPCNLGQMTSQCLSLLMCKMGIIIASNWVEVKIE